MDCAANVTVVVPCFNEAERLPRLLARLRALRNERCGDWRFLFVDDGSTDDTFARLLCAARDEPRVSVLRHGENRGVGAALRTAFAHVDTPIVCTTGSGCRYPPERLPELTAVIEQGADIALVSAPRAAADGNGHGSRLHLLLNRQVSSLCRQLVGRDVLTLTSLFRAYRREVLQRIAFRGDGIAGVAELYVKAMLAGCAVRDVPMSPEGPGGAASAASASDAVLAHAQLLTVTTLTARARQARQAFWPGSTGGKPS
jgi:dolichol-phosphate mannosyltransferase